MPCEALLSCKKIIQPLFEDQPNTLTRYIDKMICYFTENIDLPEYLERSHLLQRNQHGFRVIDILSVQGRLREVFDRARWRGREREAIALHDQVQPEYQNRNMIAALKLHVDQTPQEPSGIRRRPTK